MKIYEKESSGMKMHRIWRRDRFASGLALFGVLAAGPAGAHPMGNFAICHYTRLEAQRNGLHLRYVLDMAEIPTVTEKQIIDSDHDGVVSAAEKAAFLTMKESELRSGLALTIDGKPVSLQPLGSDLRFAPGAGGLETLKIVLDWQANVPANRQTYTVAYRDANYATRTGWKEIVAVPGPGAALEGASVPATDRSKELSVYPSDVIPPQVTTAQFTVVPGSGTTVGSTAASLSPASSAAATPRDAFTQVIARHEMTTGMMLLGLLIALVFGAFHALSPGHGKAMVAAYLVGARGTPRHAVILGLTVTITHTLGVFALGLITLFASRYVVPERLYPILSVVSGLMVCGVGLWLFYTRWRGLSSGHHHHHDHAHDHSHSYDHEPTHSHDHTLAHSHDDHAHSHEHSHDHTHCHEHSHDHVHGHSHGHGHHHHHLPEGPVTLKTLLALGISGGIVPCPSALVVLLSAIALHRTAYGMLLISAFSVGLASVLVAIGLIVVCARGWFDRFPSGGPLLQRLPVASAAIITCIGIVLVIRALG